MLISTVQSCQQKARSHMVPTWFWVGIPNSNQLAFVCKCTGRVPALSGQQKGWCFPTLRPLLDNKRFYKHCSKCCDRSGFRGIHYLFDLLAIGGGMTLVIRGGNMTVHPVSPCLKSFCHYLTIG